MGHLIAALLMRIAGIGALLSHQLFQEADGHGRLLRILVGVASAATLVGAFAMLAKSPNRAIAWLARAVLAGVLIACAAARIIDR